MIYFHNLDNAPDYQEHVRRCEAFAEDYIGSIFQGILDGGLTIEEIITLPLDNMEFVEFEDRDEFFDSGEALDPLTVATTDAKQCKADLEYAIREELVGAILNYVEEKFYCAERGAELNLIITPGGVQGGVEHGPIAINAVSLNEDNDIVYRFESDERDGQWRTGNAKDVVEYWLTRKEVIETS